MTIYMQHCPACGQPAGAISPTATIGHPCKKSRRRDEWEWFVLDSETATDDAEPPQRERLFQ